MNKIVHLVKLGGAAVAFVLVMLVFQGSTKLSDKGATAGLSTQGGKGTASSAKVA